MLGSDHLFRFDEPVEISQEQSWAAQPQDGCISHWFCAAHFSEAR
jgi:hypothetical protein